MSLGSVRLHHYTSGDGLLGILDSSCLWATSIHHLSDAKEFNHTLELATTLLYERKQASSDVILCGVCDVLVERLERLSGVVMYVACFSEVEDSLSQWRGYCPPSFGYSIGFNADRLEAIAKPQGFALKKCVYEYQKKRTLLNNWIDQLLIFVRSGCSSSADVETFCENRINDFLAGFIELSSFMKDQSFADEREWRLVALIPTNDPRTRIRAGRSMLIPYVSIDLQISLDSNLLWNIKIGPTPHIELAMDALSRYFHKMKLQNGISRTMIPYRDW